MSKRTFIIGSLFGATVGYLLDPTSGNRRRNVTGDQLGSLGRKLGKQAGKKAGYVGNAAYGVVKEAVPVRDNSNPDDLTLRDRVESEIFRDTETGRENINVFVVDGVVTVRGEQPTQTMIDDLIGRIRSVSGVKGVESYLHLPGTVAPNKAEAIEASEQAERSTPR